MRGLSLGRLFMIGLALLVGGCFFAWDRISSLWTYEQVAARIESIKVQCRFDDMTEDRDCREIEARHKRDPRYHGMTVRRNTIIRVRYLSPADSKQHIGTLRFAGDMARLYGYTTGGSAFIMANSWDPKKIRRL